MKGGDGRAAVDHLVQDASHAPDVARSAQLHNGVAVATRQERPPPPTAAAPRRRGGRVHDGLWGHVVESADLGVSHDVSRVVRDCLGDSEVD